MSPACRKHWALCQIMSNPLQFVTASVYRKLVYAGETDSDGRAHSDRRVSGYTNFKNSHVTPWRTKPSCSYS